MEDFEDADARGGALGQDEGFGNAHDLVGGLGGFWGGLVGV